MDIPTVRTFFMWCTIFNAGVLLYAFLIFTFAGDWLYRMHGKWFPMPRETFNVVLYSFIGFYKVLITVFNLVPYLALLLMG